MVWQDHVIWEGSADWDIVAADINDLNEIQVFVVSDIADNNECNPAIHGNTVVWEDGQIGDLNIYGADITDLVNPVEFQIAAFEHDQKGPAIHRTTVVWQDNFFGDWDIYAADISDFGVLRQADPNNVVEFAIAANEFSQTNPDIDGNIIVWQDNRNNNWDIFGYNLTTRKEFQITDDSHDQTNPAISGSVVVWQDSRNGNSQIYAVVLDGPEVAWCTSGMAGDVNGDCKIDFEDFAVMASQWLDCNLEPARACRQ